jgi:hypothetical protein
MVGGGITGHGSDAARASAASVAVPSAAPEAVASGCPPSSAGGEPSIARAPDALDTPDAPAPAEAPDTPFAAPDLPDAPVVGAFAPETAPPNEPLPDPEEVEASFC